MRFPENTLSDISIHKTITYVDTSRNTSPDKNAYENFGQFSGDIDELQPHEQTILEWKNIDFYAPFKQQKVLMELGDSVESRENIVKAHQKKMH